MFFGIGSTCDGNGDDNGNHDPDNGNGNGAIDCFSLAVTMDSMSANVVAQGVMVSWTTAIEIDTVGFRVLRETISANREKRMSIAADRIPAAGIGTTGASYEFFDNSREAGIAVNYYLEDIDVHGRVTRHGKIEIVRPAQTGRQR